MFNISAESLKEERPDLISFLERKIKEANFELKNYYQTEYLTFKEFNKPFVEFIKTCLKEKGIDVQIYYDDGDSNFWLGISWKSWQNK